MSIAPHQDWVENRWRKMTLAEQLANVGAEFERAWSWRMRGQAELSANAADRMLELLALAIDDPRWRGPKLRELARLREALNEEWLSGRQELPKDLSNYFMVFTRWARAGN